MKKPVAFGKYLLLDRISVGGMAEVFQAKSFGVEGFEKILAIKRILPSMAEDAEFIEMFIDEAKIAGQLSHPNICQIFELGKIEKAHFIAMEFVWGKDTLQIQNRFRRLRRRMPLPMAAFIAAKVCEGLDYAHRKRDAESKPLNIIHRDVSPQNILVSYEGEVKIIDFGIATAVSRSSKTQAGVLKGKFGYMSPEQVRGLPLDRRSDLFALGTLLYEMCVGERLFTGDGDFAVLEKVRNADVLPPSSLNPAVPTELERIVLKALARMADDRYQAANEMHDDLMNFLMSQEPVFTSKQMAASLKDNFAKEFNREKEALESYKKITKDALERYAPTGDSELAVSLLSGPGSPHSGTDVGVPDFDELIPQIPSEEVMEIVDGPFDEEENLTQVYDDHGMVGGTVMPAEPTFIFNAEAGELVHAPDQATVILSNLGTDGGGGGSNGGGAVVPHLSQGPTVIFDVGTLSPVPDPATSAVISGTVPMIAPRSSIFKDMLIGVLLAVVVILGVVLWRVFSSDSTPMMATAVISTSPPTQVVEVRVDGRPVGMTKAGMPFTRRIPSGEHTISVSPPNGKPITKEVVLQPGQVRVVSFVIAKAVGHLKLKISPPTARVFINGAEVSAAAVKRPLELAADKEHEIRIVAGPAFALQKIKVRLRAGERIDRKVELKRAPRVIHFKSDPQGATILIDGVSRGVTPLTLGDLKPGRYRVQFKLEGHASRYALLVVRDGEQELTLDKKLHPRTTEPGTPTAGTDPDKPPKPRPLRTKSAAAKKGPPGFLVANTSPVWAKVFVDGKDTKRTTPIPPRSKISLSPGPHKVTFVAEGKKFTFEVNIESEKITRLIKTLPLKSQ